MEMIYLMFLAMLQTPLRKIISFILNLLSSLYFRCRKCCVMPSQYRSLLELSVKSMQTLISFGSKIFFILNYTYSSRKISLSKLNQISSYRIILTLKGSLMRRSVFSVAVMGMGLGSITPILFFQSHHKKYNLMELSLDLEIVPSSYNSFPFFL